MNTRKIGRSVSVTLIAMALIAAMVCGFTFAENTVTPINVSSLVNTTTDAAQVTSPFIDIIARVQNSVVGVNNYQTYMYQGSRYSSRGGSRESVEQLAGTGSGVVIYDGYVLTNYHVIEDSSRVSVSVLGQEEELAGEVVGMDASLDIAIIYVEGLNLPAVELGDSDALQVGEWAICIGNPLSEELAGTVTVGIISALNREISTTTTTDKYGLKTKVTNSMIQTNAAINAGNSGGGMFNILGQLQGIPSMKYTGSYYSGATVEGIGLAIPINSAKALIEEVLGEGRKTVDEKQADASEAKDSGSEDSTGKPRLGISAAPINGTSNYAVYMGVLPSGVVIAEVEEDSPALTAGLQADDIIVEADGEIISSVEGLRLKLSEKKAGDEIQIKVYRVEGWRDAQYISDIGEGEYLDFTVILTDLT